jgi:hypothetical protein
MPGVYVITNTVNGMTYIGSSYEVRKRINQHRSALRRGNHIIGLLQKDWDQFGEAKFNFVSGDLIPTEFLPGILHILEQTLIDSAYEDGRRLYNATHVTRSGSGIRHLLATAAARAMAQTEGVETYSQTPRLSFWETLRAHWEGWRGRDTLWTQAERRRAEIEANLQRNTAAQVAAALRVAGFSERETAVAVKRFTPGAWEYSRSVLLAVSASRSQ